MKIDHIYFTGDIHGQFEPLVFTLISGKYQLKDSAVFVCGDIGMGFCKPNYYNELFLRMNKKLSKNNVHLYFIRGNHDDPSYFHNTPDKLKNISHIHLIDDWDTVQINDHNILCIGGATSTDRIYRTVNVSWWADESVTEIPDDLKYNCDIIISHTGPMFVPPKYERIPWMDESDDERAKLDRKILAKLYFQMCENNNPVKYWFYGHYHDHFESSLPNTGKFSDYEKNLLLGGSDIDTEFFTDNLCQFIGLNMSENNGVNLDLFQLC